MRILITGAYGQLGQSLQHVLRNHELIPTGRRYSDISNNSVISQIISKAPTLVIHAAARTNVEKCEIDRDDAYLVNAEGTKNVALACIECNATIVYVSTDYVFDGTKGTAYLETDTPNPVNVYGATKLAGEKFVQESGIKKFFIVRTGWLYGHGGINFVTKILDRAGHSSLDVVTNQWGSPTYTNDLAAAIASLIRLPASGIYHLANEGGCSRFEFAKAILEYAGIKDTPVNPTNYYQRRAKVPPNAVLKNTRAAEYEIVLRPWRYALRAYFGEH